MIKKRKNDCVDAEKIIKIKAAYKQKKTNSGQVNDPFTTVSYRSLANQYNISHTLVASIVHGEYDFLLK